MKFRVITGLVLTLFLASILTLAFDIQPAIAVEPPATEWDKTYGETGSDFAVSVVQTQDGGYAIAGFTWSFGAGEHDFWLVKVAGEIPPVGGIIVPINKPELLMPYIGLVSVILATITVVVKKGKIDSHRRS